MEKSKFILTMSLFKNDIEYKRKIFDCLDNNELYSMISAINKHAIKLEKLGITIKKHIQQI